MFYIKRYGAKSFLFSDDDFALKSKINRVRGFCKLVKREYRRRIDIRCISLDSLPSALLYFTGSGEFNKNMRTFGNVQIVTFLTRVAG